MEKGIWLILSVSLCQSDNNKRFHFIQMIFADDRRFLQSLNPFYSVWYYIVFFCSYNIHMAVWEDKAAPPPPPFWQCISPSHKNPTKAKVYSSKSKSKSPHSLHSPAHLHKTWFSLFFWMPSFSWYGWTELWKDCFWWGAAQFDSNWFIKLLIVWFERTARLYNSAHY